ncbi:MAG: YbfB/YjiJ family MFS transporter [Paucibacter sp.]|nr:YbfB/YjiJ family MFS transporter [Roseateles sp.]
MSSAIANSSLAPSPDVWRATVTGACASLIGIGLARFAYTPLLPAIIDAHWFSASAATYLGAVNLGEYLAGALAGGAMARRTSATLVLRAMMLVATASFAACAIPVSFLWFLNWRFAAGVSGGGLMVLAAPIILAHVPPIREVTETLERVLHKPPEWTHVSVEDIDTDKLGFAGRTTSELRKERS